MAALLGLLLIGIVGAFYFLHSNWQTASNEQPTTSNATEQATGKLGLEENSNQDAEVDQETSVGPTANVAESFPEPELTDKSSPSPRNSKQAPPELLDSPTSNAEPPVKPADSGVGSSLPVDENIAAASAKPDQPVSIEVDEPVTTQGDLGKQAHAILQTQCGNCHRGGDADEGGFDFVMNRDQLVSSGYVQPKDPNHSLLLERMKSNDAPMPPAGEQPRPSADDIKVVRDWIRAGADPFTETKKQPFVSTDQLYTLIAADLDKVKKRDREYIRYFSVSHLGNAGFSKAEIELYGKALAKLLNSLSWNRQIAALQAIENCETTFRVDLRDLKWTDKNWNLILTDYSYAVVYNSRDALHVRTETKSEVPVVRADWFVAHASRPPLYHDLLQIPNTDAKLERMLQVNVKKNLSEERVVRSAFSRSGVSQNNRMIERHESSFGAYWKSYDFGGNTGRKNLFEHPLGPGDSVDDFDHDGGEIIFSLPNGMLGYMLIDSFGRRIDKGPTEIVSDPRQADRAVVNGVSCMSCHYGGFIPKDDEIRKHVVASKSAYDRFDDIMALYREPKESEALLLKDTQVYLQKLKQIGITEPTRAGEPIVLVANRYTNEVDANLAAAELGIPPDQFKAGLKSISDSSLTRQIGALKVTGGVVKRETFDQVFLSLVSEMKLGHRSLLATDATAKQRLADRRSSGRTGTTANSTSRSAAAEQALNAGIKAFSAEKWDLALSKFEETISLAPNSSYRVRAFERAIPIYEKRGMLDKLIEGHLAILDVVTDTASIQKAHNRFYNSLQRYERRESGLISSWSSRHSGNNSFPSKLELSVSTANAVGKAFEARLKKEPNHEPTLWVLETFYNVIQDSKQKQLACLIKLNEIVQARGEDLEYQHEANLAFLYIHLGEPKKGALIYKRRNDKLKNRPGTGGVLVREAEAWLAADEKDEALDVLDRAAKTFKNSTERNSAYSIVKIADMYMKMDEPEKAIPLYKQALEIDPTAYRIEDLQKKLETALVKSGKSKGNDSDINELLDPLRQFRLKAEKLETERGTEPATIYRNMVGAASNWIKAKESKKAIAALKKATKALRRMAVGYGTEKNHETLARMYLRLELNQEALGHFVSALKLSKRESDIVKLQREVTVLIEEDSSLKVPKEIAAIADPNFKFRTQAKNLEAETKSSDYSYADKMVRATTFWLKAGDLEEVKRCGQKAEKAILRIKPSSGSSAYSRHESVHKKLAEVYQAAELFPEAIEQFIAAMTRAGRDDKAVKYHATIQAICQEQNIAMPKLPDAAAVKLDPLNRFRVKAAEDEASALKYPTMADSEYKSAAENWIKANETDKALSAAKKCAKAVLANKSSGVFGYRCEQLAKLYEQLDQKEDAIKFYTHARDSENNDRQKEKYQQKIDDLNSPDE